MHESEKDLVVVALLFKSCSLNLSKRIRFILYVSYKRCYAYFYRVLSLCVCVFWCEEIMRKSVCSVVSFSAFADSRAERHALAATTTNRHSDTYTYIHIRHHHHVSLLLFLARDTPNDLKSPSTATHGFSTFTRTTSTARNRFKISLQISSPTVSIKSL